MIAVKYNPDVVTKVKAIKGARYNNTERYWTIPYSENYRDILNSGFAGDSIVTVENSSNTTEIYTHVSNTMIGNIKSPLDGIL